jgi:D-arabinose 1-dehydrogenase-like Zn-dependent alcohol dehydrogenase
MILGHEGVGVVEAVGSDCRFLKKRDRVGWGYEVDSCGHCLECLQGTETYCPERSLYGVKNFDQGSFATHAIRREAFLHPIPDGLSDLDAAPLQCGGATMFTALNGIKPSDTVGILGVGDLGHLAIQFAAKMGCRVVLLSGSDRKKDEALRLGTYEFIATKGVTEPSIYPLSVASGNFEIPYMALILQGITVVATIARGPEVSAPADDGFRRSAPDQAHRGDVSHDGRGDQGGNGEVGPRGDVLPGCFDTGVTFTN